MNYKFRNKPNGNVQKEVYELMNSYYEDTGRIMSYEILHSTVQNNRFMNCKRFFLRSTIARSYRRMKKVFEWKIIQKDLDRKQAEFDIEVEKTFQRLKLENEKREDREAKIFGIVAIIWTAIIIALTLYSIFITHV